MPVFLHWILGPVQGKVAKNIWKGKKGLRRVRVDGAHCDVHKKKKWSPTS